MTPQLPRALQGLANEMQGFATGGAHAQGELGLARYGTCNGAKKSRRANALFFI
jgi:hypothetical protein